MENAEGKSVQEFSLSQQATHWLQTPAGSFAQKVGDIVQLRNLSLTEIDLLLELSDGPVEFVARVRLVHVDQVLVAEGPHLFLGLCVVQPRDRVAHPVVHGHLCDFFSTLFVDWIAEGWMVSLLDSIALRKHALSDMVEVIDVDGEPRHGLLSNLSDALGDSFKLAHSHLHVLVFEAAVEVDVEIDDALAIVCGLRWTRLDRRHVDVLLLQNAQRFIENTGPVFEGQENADSVFHLPKFDCVIRVRLASQSVSQIAHAHHAAESSLLRGQEKAARARQRRVQKVVPSGSSARSKQFAKVGSEALHLE